MRVNLTALSEFSLKFFTKKYTFFIFSFIWTMARSFYLSFLSLCLMGETFACHGVKHLWATRRALWRKNLQAHGALNHGKKPSSWPWLKKSYIAKKRLKKMAKTAIFLWSMGRQIF